jgi:hypothetical protein
MTFATTVFYNLVVFFFVAGVTKWLVHWANVRPPRVRIPPGAPLPADLTYFNYTYTCSAPTPAMFFFKIGNNYDMNHNILSLPWMPHFVLIVCLE